MSPSCSGLMPNYRQAFIGCNAETFSPDAVVHFNLTQPTRVRLNTTGSAFDTAVCTETGASSWLSEVGKSFGSP